MSSVPFLSSCSKWVRFGALTLVLAGLAHAQDSDNHATHTGGDSIAKPTGRMITLSDFGAEDLAYLAIPATPPTLAIVLVPDAYGLDDFTKHEADWLADQGYLVAAVDIYNGKQTTDPDDLANMIANMNADGVMKTVDAGIRFFHESPKFQVGHVVVMGWGTGASYVFQAARESKDIDGAITFYGPIVTPDQPVGKFTAPLCGLYPANDPVTTREAVLGFLQKMKDAGNDAEGWFIAAGSGWSNPKTKTYSPVEDKEAWKVALPFLVRIGSQPVKQKKESILDKAKEKFDDIFKSQSQ